MQFVLGEKEEKNDRLTAADSEILSARLEEERSKKEMFHAEKSGGPKEQIEERVKAAKAAVIDAQRRRLTLVRLMRVASESNTATEKETDLGVLDNLQ